MPQLQLTGSKNRTRLAYKSHSGACQGKHHWNSCIGFDKAAILTYSCSWPDGLTTIQLTLVCVSASAHDHGLHEVQEDHSEPSSTRRPCKEGTRLPTGPKTVRRVWLCPADSRVLAVPQDASDAFAHASAAAEATEQIPPDDSVGRLDDVYQQLASLAGGNR